jgi:hypothetical protein
VARWDRFNAEQYVEMSIPDLIEYANIQSETDVLPNQFSEASRREQAQVEGESVRPRSRGRVVAHECGTSIRTY